MITLISHETPSSSSSSSDEDSDDESCETDKEVKCKQNAAEKEMNRKEKTSSNNNKRNRKKSKRKQHPCPYCEKTFPFPNKLREHIEVHKTDRYECMECPSPRKFDKFNDLKAHCKQYHSRASHKCSVCSYTNSRPADVKRHFQQNHIDGVPCTIIGCSMKVAKNRLKTHIKEMHSIPLEISSVPIRAKLSFHKCPNCGYEPDQSIVEAEDQYKDLMSHMETMHEKKKTKKECKFGCGISLLPEEETNHQDKCPKLIPDESCSSTPMLNNDSCCYTNTVTSQSMLSETSEEDQESVESSSNTLNEELEEEHEGTGRSSKDPPRKKMKKNENQFKTEFACEICGKESLSRDSLRKHVWSCHSGSNREGKTSRKQFKCDRKSMIEGEDYCEKTFRTEQSLRDHYNVHDNIKPYVCKSCDQSFYSRDRFAVHLSKYHQTSIKNYN
ncbi:hypothetical protein GCK72_006038 [Caenorhabditis remanei]|uniref:C2H2-type domain-containing protein n=1 Tax=Caenorhabditis remanei TaxID=31234 RepID=E3M4N1_CAERE|nr:hypothetical protein GCK72_006038 [Caenorhabditis remanei]EFO91416.1 hypothetical protein CRE_11782 [Caenorhabditis remanei]KAF1766082.1 hypothetical protein GCK72_006038 [Caenorhabditis remanei]